MRIIELIMFELLGVILVSNWYLKIVCLSLLIFLVIYNKDKINIKEVSKLLIYILVIVSLNYLLDFKLDLLNFVYFGIFSLFVYFSRLKVKFEGFLSFYLLLVLIKGVIIVCLSL